MAKILELNRINIQIPDAGIVRTVAGATVTIYNTMPDGSAAVTSAGVVSPGAVKAILYADRLASTTKANPLTADSQGLVEFYTNDSLVHVLVSTPNGVVYGVPWFSTFSTDVVNFESFGAIGDGVTDDTAAILAAYNALPSNGGKITLGQDKKYKFSSQLLISKKVHFEGAVSTDVENPFSNCELVKASTLNTTGIVFTASGCQLNNLSVRGEVGNGGDGIQIKARDCVLRNVAVVKMGGHGIRLGHSDSTNSNLNQFYNVCSRGNGGSGFYLHSDDSNVTINDNVNTFVGCEGMFNGEHGLRISNSLNNVFINWHAESNTGHGIFMENRAQKNVFVGMFMEGNGAGINVSSALAVDNIFIGGTNNDSFSANSSSRTMRLTSAINTTIPVGLGEVMSNGAGGTFAGSDTAYIAMYGAASERIRFGYKVDGPATGLVPAQLLVDANTLFLYSRDTAAGKVRLAASSGLAGYLLLDPQNSKLETNQSLQILTQFIELGMMTEPGAPAANKGRIYIKDNGAGKSQLCVRFDSGAVQVLATEP